MITTCPSPTRCPCGPRNEFCGLHFPSFSSTHFLFSPYPEGRRRKPDRSGPFHQGPQRFFRKPLPFDPKISPQLVPPADRGISSPECFLKNTFAFQKKTRHPTRFQIPYSPNPRNPTGFLSHLILSCASITLPLFPQIDN